MARKSKSSKKSNKTESSNTADPVESDAENVAETDESSADGAPEVIEAEAIDVTDVEETALDTEASDDGGAVEEAVEEIEAQDDADTTDTSQETESNPEESDSEPEDPPLAEPEDQPVAVAPPPPAAEPRSSSPLPLVLGGLIAGGIGYFAAVAGQPGPVDTSALSESVSETEAQLETLSGTVADLQNTPAPTVDLSGIEAAMADLSGRFDVLDGDVGIVRDEIAGALSQFEETSNSLSDRLTVLETAGPGDSEEARATEQDLAAFRAELERMTSAAEDRVAQSMQRASEIETSAIAAATEAEEAAAEAERQAAEAAALAEREAAVASIKTAVESGQSFVDEVNLLGDVPDVLAANAETGVVTLIELQQTYADSARLALADAEIVPQDASAGDRLVAFFKQRTNARSLAPVEGDGADAVLSRAEASMKQGDLGAALSELDALAEAPKAAMQDWLDKAKSREAALAAVEQLTVTN